MFTYEERDILNYALEKTRLEYGDIDPFLGQETPSILQEHYTWEECKILLSALENVQGDDFIHYAQWTGVYSKVQGIALALFKDYRIQECRRKTGTNENGDPVYCRGQLIFLDHKGKSGGKIPITQLIPDKHLQKIIPTGITEDLLGYIIAFCPECDYIQVYEG